MQVKEYYDAFPHLSEKEDARAPPNALKPSKHICKGGQKKERDEKKKHTK